MLGRVVSVKNRNTVTVLVERVATHPLYKKTFIRSKKYLVDDLLGVKLGDLVEIINVKPVSRKKHWRVVKVVGKSLAEITKEKLKVSAEAAISEVMPEEKIELSDEKQELKEKTGKKEENSEKKARTGQSVRKSKITK